MRAADSPSSSGSIISAASSSNTEATAATSRLTPATQLLDAIDSAPDRRHPRVRQFLAGAELQHDRPQEILSGTLVTVDRDRAERLEVDEHLGVMSSPEGHQARDRRRQLGLRD